MQTLNIPIPLWARALSGIAALFSAAVLVWYFWQLPLAQVSSRQIVFLAPNLATIFAAYIAIAGKLPKFIQPKHPGYRHT